MSDSYIDLVFGEGGILAHKFEGYRPRIQQIELAQAVDTALSQGGRLLAEAPTGVGKSIGYGVPSAYHAANHGRRVAIVTANIALQEQLVGKDLPLLQEILPWRFSFALAKGINNYLCRYRHQEAVEDVMWLPREAADVQRQWADVELWAAQTQRGDLSELSFELDGKLKHRLTIASDDCLGRACKHEAACFPREARRRYRQTEVVVTNYHLFFAHLAVVKQSDGAAGILPPVDVAIFDEGHNAAEIARDFFGFRVTAGSVRWAARLLSPSQKGREPKPVINAELAQHIGREADRFFEQLRGYRQNKSYLARMREKDPVESAGLLTAMEKAAEAYKAEQVKVTEPARKEELGRAIRRCYEVRSNIEEAMALSNRARVYHVELEGQRTALCAKQLDVAPVLRDEIFERELEHMGEHEEGESRPKTRGYHAAVVTSATLSVNGNFDLFACELGAESAEELAVGSPFDLPNQALLVIPTGMPDPRDKERFAVHVADRLADTIYQAKGRTLALFTSYRVLDIAHKALLSLHLPYAILRQGEAPRTKLIRAFKSDTSSVLLGTASLWEGVDVPGESLSCVFMDKLPFAMPDDPIEDALSEKLGRDYFKKRSMPQAIIAFRQGFGRLIRSTTDHGVVVCCDRRLTDKPYGRSFIKALGGVRVSYKLDDIGQFLEARRAA